MIPRLVVAGTHSGAGKTTVATGLRAARRRRGLDVSPHKVGPDYIDPGYHALATGRPGRNLDPVLQGEERVVPLFLHGSAGADVAVVEGVMGLYDGRGSSDEGSTAHVARLLGAPVVLVVDASSQSRSVAALVHGFATYGDVRLAGVVLNKVASDRHERVLREALDVPVLGVLRRDAEVETPSRHLGLVPVAERAPEAVATVERLSRLVAQSCDLDALLEVARAAGPLVGEPWSPPAVPREQRPVVALAGGAAFTFAYTETAEALTAAGADVVVVDPLRDSALPEGTRALVVPGGFPEVYALQLAANTSFLEGVRRHLAAGLPAYAECAGLLLLGKALEGSAMVGHFDGVAAMTPTLTLGYRTAVSHGSVVADEGVVVTGHEFHRTQVDPPCGAAPAWTVDGTPEGFTSPGVVASYLHLHPAGVPELALRIVEAACA